MAEQKFNIKSGFFNSVDGDRKYSADELNRPYKRIITEGIFATPQGTPSTDLQVLSTNNEMNVIVKKGEGLLGEKWFENPSDLAITISNNTSIVPRIDSIIIQTDKRQGGRAANIIYREGLANSNPMPPAINSVENIIEKRVANIYVAPGTTSINQNNITDLRGSDECLWITSLIKQVDTSELFKQWQTAYEDYYNGSTADFESWFEGIKNQLSTDAAGNLQNQINEHTADISLLRTDVEKNLRVNVKRKNMLLTVQTNKLVWLDEIKYFVGNNDLKIYCEGAFLINGVNYEEFGEEGQISNTIKFLYDTNQNNNYEFMYNEITGEVNTILNEEQAITIVQEYLVNIIGELSSQYYKLEEDEETEEEYTYILKLIIEDGVESNYSQLAINKHNYEVSSVLNGFTLTIAMAIIVAKNNFKSGQYTLSNNYIVELKEFDAQSNLGGVGAIYRIKITDITQGVFDDVWILPNGTIARG